MINARIKYLLRHNRGLFLSKVRQRLQRQLNYKRLVRAALRGLRNGQRLELAQSDSDLLECVSHSVPIVLLEKRNGYVRCGLRFEDVPALISTICLSLTDIGLLSRGRFRAFDPKNLMRRCYSSPGFTLGPLNGTAPKRWRFEIFEVTEAGSFVSRSGVNKVTGVLYGDVFQNQGVVDLQDRMPELIRQVNTREIDVVYTWVNSNDLEWRKLFSQAVPPHQASNDALSECRFYSNDELRYSLRSVYRHLPWVRRIFIVSNCRPPTWLDIAHKKISWVSHGAILGSDCVPTFNSHALEASLHRIPGLAENFLYFNDDMLAFDALSPSDFINENGTLIANLERQGVVNSAVDPGAPDYLNASRNSARLLFDRFAYYPTRLHRHTPYSLSKSLLSELETEFQQAFEATRKSRFRSMNDINVASFLAHHYGFVRRDVVYSGYRSALIKSNDPFSLLKMRIADHSRKRPKVLCINEGGSPAPTSTWREQAAAFMAQQFPSAAPWECEDAPISKGKLRDPGGDQHASN